MKCELHQPNKSKAKAGQCRTCRNLVSVSHLRQYDSKANDGICRTCWRKATALEAATAKVCPQCSTPLKPAATPGSWCQSCAYPPCAGCQQVARPTGGSYQAKNRPVWLCPACKVCPQCGKPLPASSAPGLLCQTCAYPPCAGCQKVARQERHGTMPRSDPFGGAQNAPKPAVRCAKPIQLVQMPAADQTPRARSVQNVVPSAQNANTQCSAARIPTAGATGVPFRPAQVAVVDRARADAEETKTHVTNIMPNSCRSGRARRASYHKKDRPNAVRSKWTTKQTPCHRCRRRGATGT